jgi:Ca2+-binding EF-hand superfamily protein
MLKTMGEPLTEEDVEHLMKEVNIDGDKRVNIQEFVTYMLATST